MILSTFLSRKPPSLRRPFSGVFTLSRAIAQIVSRRLPSLSSGAFVPPVRQPRIANTTPPVTSAPAIHPLIVMARSLARGSACCQRDDESDRCHCGRHERPHHQVVALQERTSRRRREHHRERAQ